MTRKGKEDQRIPEHEKIFNPGVDYAGDTEPDQGPELPPDILITQYGNAERLVFYFAGLIAYFHAERIWLRWVDTHWARDSYNSVVKLVVQSIRNIITVEIPWLKYLHKKAKDEGKAYDLVLPGQGWIEKSLSRSSIKATADLAASLLPLEVELDSHKYLLNVPNGTIELKTGELRPHNQKDYITKLAPVSFDRDAACPKFLKLLERAFPENPAGIRFIQKLLGYALTGDVSEKRFFIFWGAAGNNGKTLIFNVIRSILGACYRVQLSSESLVSGRINSIRSDLAKLKGYRFVTASETDKKYQFNEALIKVLTGGDTLTARHPHEKEIEFEPELKLFLGTNPKPEFTVSDDAMMNRVCIIPFKVSIPPEEQNKNLTQELIAEEASGILAWMVQGAVLWAREGLGENPFDQQEAAVIKHVVKLEQFLVDCCDRGDKNNKTSASELLKAYNAYKNDKDDPTPDSNDKEFAALLDEAGISSKSTNKGKMRLGITLNKYGQRLLQAAISDQPKASAKDVKGVDGVKSESAEKSVE
ncbi:hypothetical protein KP003_02995 [Geomonas nitrogeniifigens]|uniref:DNA primase family protein n=1 Tax=Geomonas diazotrophica TaxID=2843197 RepID=UPI001C2C9DCE|nr:phage/plasmid primase, P4 family [Geomonas nitrogeniifigens]QXE87392.1 hypothetical protein KP003_02995 [Geomonas nitrogeniifigens]